jgi:hypothetical protein
MCVVDPAYGTIIDTKGGEPIIWLPLPMISCCCLLLPRFRSLSVLTLLHIHLDHRRHVRIVRDVCVRRIPPGKKSRVFHLPPVESLPPIVHRRHLVQQPASSLPISLRLPLRQTTPGHVLRSSAESAPPGGGYPCRGTGGLRNRPRTRAPRQGGTAWTG